MKQRFLDEAHRQVFWAINNQMIAAGADELYVRAFVHEHPSDTQRGLALYRRNSVYFAEDALYEMITSESVKWLYQEMRRLYRFHAQGIRRCKITA